MGFGNALGKALGPAATGLLGFGEYATARSQGESQGRALLRGGVEAASTTYQWAAQPFSDAAAAAPASLFNPAQAIDSARMWAGDTAAKARVSGRLAESRASRAQVKGFYEDFAGNTVKQALGPSKPSGTPGGIGLGGAIAGVAVAGGTIAGLARGRAPKMAPAKVGKAAKAAQSVASAAKASKAAKAAQAAAATPAGQKAAQAAKKAAQTAQATTKSSGFQKFANDFHGQFTKKIASPGAILGVGAFGAVVSPIFGLATKPAARALHVPGAGPAPAPAAAPAPGGIQGYAGGMQSALYDNPQAPWWAELPVIGNFYEPGPKGLEWQRLDHQRESGQARQETIRRGQDVTADSYKYTADQRRAQTEATARARLQGIQDTNRTKLGISDYESGRRLQGIQYQADQRNDSERYRAEQLVKGQAISAQAKLDGTRYQSDARERTGVYTAAARLEGTQYQADRQYQGQVVGAQAAMYGADRKVDAASVTAAGGVEQARVRARASMYDSDAKVTVADVTSGRQLAGTQYKADTDLKIADVTSGRQLAGTQYKADTDLTIADVTSGRRLAGEMYSADAQVTTADMTSGRKLAGEQYRADTDFAIADVQSAREASTARIQSGDQLRGQKFSSTASMMGQIAAANAGAKTSHEAVTLKMMDKGFNPLLDAGSNLYRMGKREREEKWANTVAQTHSVWDKKASQRQQERQIASNERIARMSADAEVRAARVKAQSTRYF